jgi:hypothetical protein
MFAESYGSDCKRLTIAEDMTTPEGLATALEFVKQAKQKNQTILLWGAMPCTGGSPWQTYNIKRYPTAAAKIRTHIKIFKQLFDNFVIVSRQVIESGGVVVNEWPTGCTYWNFPVVKK